MTNKQKIATILLILLMLLAIGFVAFKLKVNNDAKEIIAHNNTVEAEFRDISSSYLETIRIVFVSEPGASIYIDENKHKQTIELLEKKQSTLLKPINNVSKNHYERIASIQTHYIHTLKDLHKLLESRECLYHKKDLLVQKHEESINISNTLSTVTTYEVSAATIERMIENIHDIQTISKDAFNCIEDSISEKMELQLKDLINEDIYKLQEYIDSYLMPLKQAFETKDDVILEELAQSDASISIRFIGLFSLDDNIVRIIDELYLEELP